MHVLGKLNQNFGDIFIGVVVIMIVIENEKIQNPDKKAQTVFKYRVK